MPTHTLFTRKQFRLTDSSSRGSAPQLLRYIFGRVCSLARRHSFRCACSPTTSYIDGGDLPTTKIMGPWQGMAEHQVLPLTLSRKILRNLEHNIISTLVYVNG